MWILLAVVCSNPSATSCSTLTWTKENFITEMQCAEVASRETPALAEQFAFVVPRCIQVPGVEEPT